MLALLEEIAKRCPGGALPSDYLVFDTETTGVNTNNDFILQFGFSFVVNRQVFATIGQILNRRGVAISPEAMKVNGITPARMEKEGVAVESYLPAILETFRANQAKGRMVVGHNIAAFDIPILTREAKLLSLQSIAFGPNEVLDTGCFVKAAQLGLSLNADETLMSFYKRVSVIRAKGVYWSLERHCFDAYNLSKYGLKKENLHGADKDCEATHFLLEELRSMKAH